MTARWTVGVLGLLCVAAAPAYGYTWHVAKDGSGDFTIIQEAVNAAASGDTIRIGPGRFNEGEVYTNPGWSEFVRVVVTQSELTLIGSGDGTIIGQEELWELDQGSHKGVVATASYGNNLIRIENIKFENMGDGIYTNEVDVEVRGCVFRHHWVSIIGGGQNTVLIENCRFENLERNGTHVTYHYTQNFVMHNCEFTLVEYYHQWSQQHVNFTGVQNGLIEDCQFIEGAGGAVVSLGSNGVIRNCIFDGQTIWGATAGPGSTLTMEGCTFRNQYHVADLYSSDTHLTARNCVIEDVQDCSVTISSVGSISFQDCDLAHGERGAVWVNNCSQSPPIHVDFTNNYWGTDNPDSIQAWIHDRNDSEDICRIVDYEPFRTDSTPVEETSLSDLKTLFR